jgi:enoyl-CoA hydratase/carnithine racemase
MAVELEQVFGLFDVDDRVKCIIVNGGDGKIFCAGADLGGSEFRRTYQRVDESRDG